MTRAIAFASFLLLIPITFWHCAIQVEGTARPLYDYVAQNPLLTLLGAAIIWVYLVVAGHAIWLTCRLYTSIMRHLA